MTALAEQLRASVEMERQHNAHDDECAALAHLARSESRWALREGREGNFKQAREYRSRMWWHLEKARQKRDLANAVRLRKLRIVT
jgi:hypothetical protein